MKTGHLAVTVDDLEAAGEFGFEVVSVDEIANELKSRRLEAIGNPGVITLKFEVPSGGVAEVAPRKKFKTD